jgi:hypothetical protein
VGKIWGATMALIDAVKKACTRLGPKGWTQLLAQHGLDITKDDLRAELERELPIDRSQKGFKDFCPAGRRGIEPGSPAMSLLYHAFASPNVHPVIAAAPADNDAYPTIAELDAIENYVYGLSALTPAGLAGLVIGVFAYQYRPDSATAHGYHADMAFSRTGIARVGTGPAAWDGPCRSFRSDPPERTDLAVSPARYGVFLARPTVKGGLLARDPVMGRREPEDEARVFYFPVHKLFAGKDCIQGATIKIEFQEYHRNDKLRRVHEAGGIKRTKGQDIDALPFVRDSINGGKLLTLQAEGASVLVVPRPYPTLVRTVKQKNTVTGKNEFARFLVPKATKNNRFALSTLLIEAEGTARRAPEYVNIRHRVISKGAGQEIEDLAKLDKEKFEDLLKAGGYEAAHFVDDTCDGAVVAVVTGMPAQLRDLAAYSLVTAPDFFPRSDQFEVTNWVRRNFQNVQEHFSQGSPWPLCEGRRPANIELPRPDAPKRKAFARDDLTVTAIVGPRFMSTKRHAQDREKRFASYLPDAASNEFAPGWDVSLGTDGKIEYYAAYGLGSPFPEDAKLCAALNSFWPAVAPDAARTFGPWPAETPDDEFTPPTATPMLDRELGYHPDHPKVRAGAATTNRGWDGEHGPFFETVGGVEFVNHANIVHSDYVANSLANAITVRLTAAIDSEELTDRMEALKSCLDELPPDIDLVSDTQLWLVTAERIADWATEPSRASAALSGKGLLFVFATTDGVENDTADVRRLRMRVVDKFDCQVAGKTLCWRQGGGPWQTITR